MKEGINVSNISSVSQDPSGGAALTYTTVILHYRRLPAFLCNANSTFTGLKISLLFTSTK